MTIGHLGIAVFRTGGGAAAAYPAPLLTDGQLTCYSVFDSGDQRKGDPKAYTIIATPGNTLIEVAHYAAATISFTLAGSIVADAANGLATILTGDTVVIKGSALNDGVYTVAGGGVAAQFTTAEALVNEGAGAMVSIYKQAAHSNNVVQDTKTGLMWSRYCSIGEKIGPASNGATNWYDVTTRFAIYAGANTVSCIMPDNIFRVIGGAALTQFHPGDCIQVVGFANAVNGLPNYYVVSALANGLDLDITVNPSNEVLIAEGAVGDTIYLNCRSVFNYMAGARLGSLSGHTDWRVPNINEAMSICDEEAPGGAPDAVAFPGYASIYSGTTQPNATTKALIAWYAPGESEPYTKTWTINAGLVRLGI